MRRAGRFALCCAVAAFLAAGVACTGSFDDDGSRSSLAGTDADSNGVRDDVDARIAEMSTDDVMGAYLSDVARNTQLVLTLDVTSADARARAFEIASATNLLVSCPPDEVNSRDAARLIDEVQGLVANTSARKEKLDQMSALISGRAFEEPDCRVVPSSSSTPSNPSAR